MHLCPKLTYIVAHEEVIGIRSTATDPKKLNEIMKLTMDVSTHRDRTLHRLHIPLLHQDRPGLLTQRLHVRLRQWLTLHQVIDLTVQIGMRRHRGGCGGGGDSLFLRSVHTVVGGGLAGTGVKIQVIVAVELPEVVEGEGDFRVRFWGF